MNHHGRSGNVYRRSYVLSSLDEFWRIALAPALRGVYFLITVLACLTGRVLLGISSYAMNRSILPYLEAKKVREKQRKVVPVFVTEAEHPHRRPLKRVDTWQPVEQPSVVQLREVSK
jgi:hypothetical protein